MPNEQFDYRQFTVLPDETWPQYIRRVFPDLAHAMYDRRTTPRDFEMFRLGSQCAFAEETYARQTCRARRSSQQIVEEFLKGLDAGEASDGPA